MKISSSKRQLGVKVATVVLMIPLAWFVLTPILKPLGGRMGLQRVAQWRQLQNDGRSLMEAREYDDAEESFRAALLYARNELMHPSREASSAFLLGGVLLLQDRFDDARVYFEENLRIKEQQEGESSPSLCPALKRLAEVSFETGDFDASLKYSQRLVSIREAESSSPDPELATALYDVARVYLRQENYTAAIPVRERIVSIREAEQRSSARELGIAYYWEALTHHLLNEYGPAEKRYRKSLGVLRGNVDPEAECFLALVRDFARLLDDTGRPEEASRLRAGKGLSASP